MKGYLVRTFIRILRRSIWLPILLAMAQPAPAQDSTITAPNALVVSLGGRGGFYTVSYERMVSRSMSVTIGGAYYGDLGFSNKRSIRTYALPLSVILPLTQSPGGLFLDLGMTPAIATGRSDDWVLIVPAIGGGYGYRPPGSGVIFRAELFVGSVASFVIPWFGVSVGHSF